MSDGIVADERPGYFTVGGALGRAFNLFGGEIGKYLLLAALLLSPTLVYSLFFAPVPASQLNALQKGLWATYQDSALLGMANFILQILLQSTVLYGAFQQMQGKGFDLAELLKSGLVRVPGVLATGILAGLAILIGLVLLIVPGAIVACALYVAVPVCVIERPGATASLSRSWELTSGSRWKILGLSLTVTVIAMVAGGIMGAIAAFAGHVAIVVATYICQVIAAAFTSVLVAVVYHDLRVSKEGIGVGEIASVFD